jgi:hypothetical protein
MKLREVNIVCRCLQAPRAPLPKCCVHLWVNLSSKDRGGRLGSTTPIRGIPCIGGAMRANVWLKTVKRRFLETLLNLSMVYAFALCFHSETHKSTLRCGDIVLCLFNLFKFSRFQRFSDRFPRIEKRFDFVGHALRFASHAPSLRIDCVRKPFLTGVLSPTHGSLAAHRIIQHVFENLSFAISIESCLGIA